MADVSTNLKDWSSTESSNNPAGTTTVGAGLDDNLRRIQATIVQDLNSKGADIASATTTDLGAVAGFYHDITGTTTITGLGAVRAGVIKIIRFRGALTFTHNATSLILPGAANITTADGDHAFCMSLGTGNWVVILYSRYASIGTAAIKNTGNAAAGNIPLNSDIQGQTLTAFTTAGTATAFTLTPTPAITANTAGIEFDVTFNAAAGTTPTLAVSGLTALNLKYRDSTGAKQAVTSTQVPNGWRSKVVCDGTDWVVREVPSQINPSTWTPAITFVTPGNLSVTYSVQLGDEIVIGKLRIATCVLVTSAFTHTTASGDLLITGFPASTQNVTGYRAHGACSWSGVTKANYTDINALMLQNDNKAYLYASGSGQTGVFLTAADMPSGGNVTIVFTISYLTA